MSNDPSSTRRILSRSKQNDDNEIHSSSHSSRSKIDSSSRVSSSSQTKSQSKGSISSSNGSSTSISSSFNKDVKNVEIKAETLGSSVIAEASFSSVANTQTQNQQQIAHNLAISYINKEPFNEDIEIEECPNFQDLKWRKMVFENFKQVIDDISKLQSLKPENVSFFFKISI